MALLDDELMIAARMPPPIAAKGEAGAAPEVGTRVAQAIPQRDAGRGRGGVKGITWIVDGDCGRHREWVRHNRLRHGAVPARRPRETGGFAPSGARQGRARMASSSGARKARS